MHKHVKHPPALRYLPGRAGNLGSGGLFLLMLMLLFGLSMGFSIPSAAAAESRVLPQLSNDAAARPQDRFRVVIQRVRRSLIADREVGLNGGSKIRDLLGADAFVAELPGRAITLLGRYPAVKFISYDAPMLKTGTITVSAANLGTLYPATVGAPKLWASGITGRGVGVAVVDTGVAPGLKDWNSSAGISRLTVSVETALLTKSTNDIYGHGTHVAGIIAGNNWSSSTAPGKYIGIAPEADILNVRAASAPGLTFVSDVVDAIDWVIANRQTYNIRVMNISMVSSVAESAQTSMLSAAIERAWFSGILVVVAAGNNGPGTMYYSPANDPFVVTVGAADPVGTANPADDGMSPWSSYGITQSGVSKPEVVAPGRYITAPLASTSIKLATEYPTRIVDTNYIWLSGTSMAAPVVSGVAALAFQVHPEWTNDQVKWLLTQTARPLAGAPAGQGAGQVDAVALVNYAGAPGFANQGLAPNEQLLTPDGTLSYNSANWSTSNWSTSNWSTSNWSTSNWSTSNWSTSNWSTSNWSIVTEQSVE